MKGLTFLMRDIIRSIIDNAWLMFRHPTVKINGIHHIRMNTEIIVKKKGTIILGKGVQTARNVSLSTVGGQLQIGNNVFINRHTIIVCRDTIKIGERCMFGPNVVVYDHDHVFNTDGIIDEKYSTGIIEIERNCWIGANVTILRGTHIGEGSVIGAGTIVKGYIPPHSIVTSNRELNIRRIETVK